MPAGVTLRRAALVVLLAGSLTACTSGGSPGSPSPPTTSTSATSSPTRTGAGIASLPRCLSDHPDWGCGSLDVPLDREDPSAGTISIAYYGLPHGDPSAPPAEPVFATPGGPGLSGLDIAGFAAMDTLTAHHDIVAISPRGTGASEAIDCPELQDGSNGLDELKTEVAACGAQLGDASDRYGAGDVAMDVDAVREALGYDVIDYYAASYGTVSEQAYAVRFPEHLHALVLDAGFPVTDAAHQWFWGLGQPEGIVRVGATICARDAACSASDPDPEATIRWLIERVGEEPLEGDGVDADGQTISVMVDQAEVANIIRTFDFGALYSNPVEVVAAAHDLRDGDPGPLLDLAAKNPLWGLDGGDPAFFSAGDNAAAQCNDADFVWDRADPVEVREPKFETALSALAPDTFSPFTVEGWQDYGWSDICVGWPAPDRFEPAIPVGATFPTVPTLILAGDIDAIIPVEQVEALQDEFPGATFAVVSGAGHPVTGSAWGHCAAELVAQLFDTLEVTETSCAAAPA